MNALLEVASDAPGNPGSTIGLPWAESSGKSIEEPEAGAVVVVACLRSKEPALDFEVGLVCAFDEEPFSGIDMDLTAFASGVLILVAAARAKLAASAAAPAVAGSDFSSDLDCVFGDK